MKNLSYKFLKNSNKLLSINIQDDFNRVSPANRVTGDRRDHENLYTFCQLNFLLRYIPNEYLNQEISFLPENFLYSTDYVAEESYVEWVKFDFKIPFGDHKQNLEDYLGNYRDFVEKNPEYKEVTKDDALLFLKKAMGNEAYYNYIMDKIDNDETINSFIENIWNKLSTN